MISVLVAFRNLRKAFSPLGLSSLNPYSLKLVFNCEYDPWNFEYRLNAFISDAFFDCLIRLVL